MPGKYIDDKGHFPDQSLTVALIYAKSLPYSQSCSISNIWPPIRIYTYFGVQTPCVLHVPGFPGNIFWICSLLHPLKKWSLRHTRGDSYRIKREIGRGGFGIVELGRADNGCDYALKKLNIEAFSPSEIPVLTKRFKREVRYQNQINHPNVVEVIEYSLNEEPPWFVMPLARCIVRPNVQITSSERLIQADIYSFGAILHDIFHGGTRVPHSILSVSGPIGRIVKKCTETNARRRYRPVAKLRE